MLATAIDKIENSLGCVAVAPSAVPARCGSIDMSSVDLAQR